ncbi:MAG TPA: nuclear transport factor 2 family protein [Gammaproteobacteria bacterium]|nr:nuclear transport factor 2 family protein [Gammaproteobacteria bacterium]
MRSDVVAVVEEQFKAYNRKNAEEWASTYSEDAVQKTMDGATLALGRADIQQKIQDRFKEPDLKATLIKRSVYDNVVIDHEHIVRNFPEGLGSVEMLCIYTVENGYIKQGIFKVFNQQLTKPSNGASR